MFYDLLVLLYYFDGKFFTYLLTYLLSSIYVSIRSINMVVFLCLICFYLFVISVNPRAKSKSTGLKTNLARETI